VYKDTRIAGNVTGQYSKFQFSRIQNSSINAYFKIPIKLIHPSFFSSERLRTMRFFCYTLFRLSI